MKITLFQGILMGVFAFAGLIGLFVFATYTGRGGPDAIGSVVIWGTLPKQGVESAVALMAQTDTKLKSVSYVEKNADTIATDLAAAIATGNAPDLVLASQEELFSLGKFIVPIASGNLSEGTFTSTFIQGAGIYSAPGGYYGVPILVDPLVLFYNRSMLSSSGIAKPPATWEALTGLVPSIAVLTPTRQVTRGLIALGTYGNVRNARAILSTLFFQTGVPVVGLSASGILAANLGIQGAGGTPPGQAVLSFYTQFADPAKVSYTWNASLPDSQQVFLAGDLALYLGYASEARYLKAANPNLSFGTAPLPQPATASTKSAYGRIYALMIPRGAKNPSGGYQVAALFSNAAEQTALASNTGLAPANLNVLANGSSDIVGSIAAAEALYTGGWLSPGALAADGVFSGMINNVISGRFTLELALSNAERGLTALLQQ